MSKAETQFVPLSELRDYSDDHLAWRVGFPDYVPADQIGINVDRVKMLSHLGGLKHLRVDSQSEETSTQQVIPNGIDGQGNATSSMIVSKTRAKLSKSEISSIEGSQFSRAISEYSWGDGIIIVNSAELASRAKEASRVENGPTLRDPQEWAKLLDKSLTIGITSAAREQLLTNVSFMSKLLLGLCVFEMYIFGKSGWVLSNPITNPILADLSSQTAPLYPKMLNSIQGERRRLSLIPAYQVDRLFLVNAIARTTKLAKVIEKKKS